MNIHDKARQIVAQSPRPMELRDAYALAKPTVRALAQKAAADGFSLPRR